MHCLFAASTRAAMADNWAAAAKIRLAQFLLNSFRIAFAPETKTMSTTSQRASVHAIAPQFLNRWSPRAFTGEEIPQPILLSLFEAARWAPSASNEQPWRFIYAKRDDKNWETFLSVLSDNNRLWARQASALVVIVSKTTRADRETGQEIKSRSHSFDAGAAWAHLALQANLLDWSTHAIGGFDRDKSRALLNIPEGYAVEAAVAIGRRGDKNTLPEALQQRETPNNRLPLENIIFAGNFQD
jgi:nitroreductase